MIESGIKPSLAVSEALHTYQQALRRHCAGQIERIILFGSQARGEATVESEVDLLVVVNWETRLGFAVFNPTSKGGKI